MPRTIALVGSNSIVAQETAKLLSARGDQLITASRHAENSAVATVSGTIAHQHFDALAPTALPWPEKLDGLVYFPGSITLKPFHRLTMEDFMRDLQINLLSAIQVLQSATNALKAADHASVVLFSTIAVDQGMPFHASIAAAKSALEGLAKSLAAEWAPRIRVNLIAPSLTDTTMAQGLLQDETKRSAAAKRHPLQVVGNATHTAALVDFLLSDSSTFMTGQILRPDGGLSSVKLFS
jgi:NAD(P)-dependent dehydrogenase (short-subunit alcohol dehydrogenase family)